MKTRKPRRRLRKSIRNGLFYIAAICCWLGYTTMAICIVDASGGTNMAAYGSPYGEPVLKTNQDKKEIKRKEPIILYDIEKGVNIIGEKEVDNSNDRSSVTQEVIESNEPIEEKIRKACNRYDVPFDIVISISRLETGWFSSSAYLEGNNPGGMSINEVPIIYETIDEGVDAFVSNLADNYFSLGLDTPEEIGRKYCPVNPEWANIVGQLVDEMNYGK